MMMPLAHAGNSFNIVVHVPALGGAQSFVVCRQGVGRIVVHHGCDHMPSCFGSIDRVDQAASPGIHMNFLCCESEPPRCAVFLQIMAAISGIHGISNGIENFTISYGLLGDLRRDVAIPFKIGHHIQVQDGPQLVWTGSTRGSNGGMFNVGKKGVNVGSLFTSQPHPCHVNHYLIPTMQCIVDGLYNHTFAFSHASVHWNRDRRLATTSISFSPQLRYLHLPLLVMHVSYSEEFIQEPHQQMSSNTAEHYSHN